MATKLIPLSARTPAIAGPQPPPALVDDRRPQAQGSSGEPVEHDAEYDRIAPASQRVLDRLARTLTGPRLPAPLACTLYQARQSMPESTPDHDEPRLNTTT